MMLRAGLAVIFLLAQAGALAAQIRLGLVLAPNLNNCIDILELEKIQATGDGHIVGTSELLAQYKEVSGWLQGYITARNLYDSDFLQGGGDLGHGISINDLMKWVFSYCRANPAQDISNAALQLTETLRKAKP